MAQVSSVLARLKRDPIADLPLAACVEQLCGECDLVWRERLLPPLVTLRLFLIQILQGNCPISALRQLSGIPFAVSSYCEARGKLPLQVLQLLLHWLQEQADRSMDVAWKIGQRILIVDGSSYSMPDTPELASHFHLAPGTKPGVGYPVGKLMGLLDAATGMFVELLALPLFQHDMRCVIGVHPMLRCGDILLGDRAFCSFAHFCLLQARGVFACMRLHQLVRSSRLVCSAGTSHAKPRPGWTRHSSLACPRSSTCGSYATRSPARAIAPTRCWWPRR